MIQNAIGDVTELAHVKQLADLGVANGKTPLTYDSYLALLFEACATFDMRRELPGKQKRAVYTTAISGIQRNKMQCLPSVIRKGWSKLAVI
jgi:hypothetical protein